MSAANGYTDGTVNISIADYLELRGIAQDVRTEVQIVTDVRKEIAEFFDSIIRPAVSDSASRSLVDRIKQALDEFLAKRKV